MAAGNILLQANDSKVADIRFEDGASGNMSVTVPKEGGTLANEAYVTSAISAIPVIPSASQTAQGTIEIATDVEIATGTDTTRAITPAGFRNASLGQGQTWQNVTGSRVLATTYTNTSGKPISVAIYGGTTTTTSMDFTIDGSVRQKFFFNNTISFAVTGIVPNNSTYSLSNGWSITAWHELR